MELRYGSNNLFALKNFFVIIFLAVLLTDSLFLELFFGKIEEDQGPAFNWEKYFLPFAVFVAILNFNRYSSGIGRIFFVLFLYLVLLVFESMISYGSYFIYPHVFAKIMLMFLVFFTYAFFKNVPQDKMHILTFIVLIGFFVDLFLYRRDILSTSAFVNTERGFAAASTYLLFFAALYFFNRYLEMGKYKFLFIFLVLMGFVAFLQHRSVWVAASVSLLVNFIVLATKTKIKVGYKLIPIAVILGFCLFLVVSLLLVDNPEVAKTFKKRFDDIGNYKSEGTGSWRYQQFNSYLPFVKEEIFFGQRFKGFELPIQFFHPEAGTPVFDDKSGHHFHSFYLDRLFYTGLFGLLLTLSPLFYFYYKVFKKDHLSIQEVTLTAFLSSALVFGLSYNWPTFLYGILGIACAFIEQEDKEEEALPETIDQIKSIKKEFV
jgi:hypothetical protein